MLRDCAVDCLFEVEVFGGLVDRPLGDAFGESEGGHDSFCEGSFGVWFFEVDDGAVALVVVDRLHPVCEPGDVFPA